ncbi:MAG: PAS domain-containing protein [Gemmataceae bacterium]|nr:PAS domain-containing protein [Gemmataceae bacterium]
MDTDRNLLVGALALQTGLIDSHQFLQACNPWRAQPDIALEEVLLERGWIVASDKLHLEYLLHRALHKHQGDAKATLTALLTATRQSLATLEALQSESTVVASDVPPDSRPPSTPTGDPALKMRYAFMNLHASGGIGRVWRARDRHLDREVAIKELLPEMASDARSAARFFREARLTGQLEHPGIVPVYELTSRPDTNQPFYTMRFVRGRTLSDAIDAYHAKRTEGRAEPLDFVGLLTAFVAVCNTIAYAHSRGVLHRDLKGANVILGDFGEVIVLDWGLAKLVGQPDEEADALRAEPGAAQDPALTLQGEVMGTPAYMAPEQAEGRLAQIDHRTDIYGLGALLYVILTGWPPFVGFSTVEVLQQVVRGHPTPPREIRPDVPAALEAVCLKALAKDPDQRYASATELAQEVQRWQDVQRRQAEEELLRSRERFELAVRGSQDGLWDWDLRTNEIYYSPRWKSMLGYEDHEIAHRLEEWEQRLHPDERERVLAANFAHAEGTTPHYEYEYRLRHKDGSYRWILARGVALRDASGKAYRMAGSHVDITERKRAEEERDRLLVREREARAEAEAAVRVLEEAREALRASEEQYRCLADLIPGVVWTARADGGIDYANQFWFHFTGMTLEQTQGSGWTAMLHSEDAPRVFQIWSQALQTGEPVEVEYRLKRAADGVYRWFLARGRPLRNREGRVVKWFGMLTDIEDQKQSEKVLRRQNALVRLLHKITVAAYEAATVEEALQVGIDQVCAYTGWPVGHVYVVAGAGSQELVPTTIWHLDRPEEFESFVRVTAATRLAAGVGLPGRVLAGKAPVWVMDVTRDANFPRAKAATNLGVKGAFGFPVLTPAGVVAVLEFFTSQPQEPDELLLQAMVHVGIQLGQVFERKTYAPRIQLTP